MPTRFPQLAAELESAVESAARRLRHREEDEVSVRPAPGKWSPKEILGHLVDSAANNHQRFVRGQQVERLVDPGYQQNEWVSLQAYQQAKWTSVLELWRLYNLHLAHVIARMPPQVDAITCQIGDSDPVSLGELGADYLRHLRHHLRQLGVE